MAKTVKRMLVIIAGIVVLAGLGVGGFWYLHRPKVPHPPTAQELQSLRVDLPENTTNLADGLIQFTLSLQADSSDTKKEITDLLPSVEDSVNEAMRGFTKSQLGSEKGINALKAAIIASVDQQLPKGKVTTVYFSTIVVQ